MFSRFHVSLLRQRISLYETGFFKSFSLGAFVVGVGNLTVGGTGKTPLVALAAEILADAGEKVCVISRGYKRENPKTQIIVSDGERILTANARQAGDEPLELARKLLGKAVVISDANRVRAAKRARETLGATAFVLDDAFQHLRARRNANIAVIDATNPFGNRKLLPFGSLREPLDGLKRADAVVITRSDLVETTEIIESLRAEIRKYNSACPIFVSTNRISNLIEAAKFFERNNFTANYKSSVQEREITEQIKINCAKSENLKTVAENPKSKFLAFCGLGNPQGFFEHLRAENFDLAATETFPDHYFYRQSDVEKLEETARKTGANALLTTAKDAVKLNDVKFGVPCFVAESETVFAGENDFRGWLLAKLEDAVKRF